MTRYIAAVRKLIGYVVDRTLLGLSSRTDTEAGMSLLRLVSTLYARILRYSRTIAD